jgi:hypothetical protein
VPNDPDEPKIPKGLLRGISRDTLAHGGAADLTYEYLEAGVGLIEEALNHDPANGTHPFLGWLTQRSVVQATTARGNLAGGLGALRDRWEPHARYISDLMRWIQNKRPERSFPKRQERLIKDALKSHATISQMIRGLSRAAQASILVNHRFRLKLLALSVLGSPKYQSSDEYKTDLYTGIDEQWLPIVHRYLQERGLELRPGIHEPDLVEILTAIGEGLALRELADPSTGARRERRLRLLGTAALALLVACIDDGNGQTLDDAANELHPPQS